MSTPPPESLESIFALARGGDLSAATGACARWVEAHPDDARAYWVLGNLAGQTGRPAEARQALERAVRLDPDEAAYHGDLGMACLALHDTDAATASLARAVQLDPGDGNRRMALAVALQRSGRQAEGVAELERCLDLLPDHPAALVSLGVARLDEGRVHDALGLLERATAAAPGHPPAWLHYARCLLALNRLDDAGPALETARRLAPQDPDVMLVEAGWARARERLDEARTRLEEATGIVPGRADIETRLAELDGLQSRAGDGLDRLGRLPESTPVAVTAVTRGRLEVQVGDPAAAVATVGPLLEQPALPVAARANLLAVRGDARAGLGDHEGAIADWCASKALRPGVFDADEFTRLVDTLIEETVVGSGPGAEAGGPLLIVGPPRSGKSILEQVLACHPDVGGAGETSWLGEAAAALSSPSRAADGGRARSGPMEPSTARRLGQAYRDHLASLAPPARWIATTLPGNLLHLGMLASVAPGARVIAMERSPLDLAVACLSKPFADPALAWSKTPRDIGVYLAGLRRLLEHWEAELGLPILHVAYEDLVTDVEAVARRALEFLDLGWDERCLRYHEAGVSRLGHSPAVREPLDSREIGLGRPYSDTLGRSLELPSDSSRGA